MLKIANNFEKLSDANLQVAAGAILAALTGNPDFPNPAPDLTALGAALDSFSAALLQAQGGGRVETADKNAKRDVLTNVLHLLGNYVLFASGGDATKAASSGFSVVKPHAAHPDLQKPEGLTVSEGINPGELNLAFNRVDGARSYLYQYTPDPLTDASQWQSQAGTVRKCVLTGLQSGKKYWCRIAAIGINGQTVYSDMVSKVVQ